MDNNVETGQVFEVPNMLKKLELTVADDSRRFAEITCALEPARLGRILKAYCLNEDGAPFMGVGLPGDDRREAQEAVSTLVRALHTVKKIVQG